MTRLTQQQAIDLNCRHCNFDDQDIGIGTLRSQIDKYPSPQCPFFEYRPLTTATKKLRQEAKVEAMSPEARAEYRAKQESARIRLTTGIKQQHNNISVT